MNLDYEVRPSIMVHLDEGLSEYTIRYLLYGLEEEGIPYTLIRGRIQSIHETAYQAAVHSSLEVGLACTEEEVVLHQKNLEIERPYLRMKRYQTLPEENVKNFGANGARLIKVLPLKKIS